MLLLLIILLQAILGGWQRVEGIAGNIDVKIPSNTQPGNDI